MKLPAGVIWGASPRGHGIVVLEAVLAGGHYRIEGFIDDDEKCVGTYVQDYPVLGTRAILPDLQTKGIENIFTGVGDNHIRMQIRQYAIDSGFLLPAVIHPAAYVASNATVGDASFIAAGAVIGAAAEIGECCIVNTGATVDHNCVMENASNICPGVHLAGKVTLREGAFVGTGASVIPDIEIGAWSVVGAGAVVISNVSSNTCVAGVPAKELK